MTTCRLNGLLLAASLLVFGCQETLDAPDSGSADAATDGSADGGAGQGGSAGQDGAGQGGAAGQDGAGQGGAAGQDGAGQGGSAGQDGAGQGGAAGQDGAGQGGAAGQDGSAGQGGSAGSGGEGGSTSLEITPEGGVLSLGQVSVDVPAGAVQESTTLTLTQLAEGAVVALPAGLDRVSAPYAFLPHGTSFGENVVITLPRSGTAPAPLVSVWRLEDELDTSWERLPVSSVSASSVTVEVAQFSVLVVAESTAQTLFTASGTVRLGHLAMGGGRIFFVFDHPYFTLTTQIGSVDLDGENPVTVLPLTVADGPYSPAISAITATASEVFYMHGDVLASLPFAGGTPSVLNTFYANASSNFENGVPRLLQDGAQLFLVHNGSSDASRALRSIDFAGTEQAVIGGDGTLINPTTVTLDGDHLLYAAHDVYRIHKSLEPATQTTVVSKDELDPFGIIVGIEQDESYIYVMTNTTAPTRTTSLFRKPRSGGPIEQVVMPNSIAGFGRGLRLERQILFFMCETMSAGAVSAKLLGIDASDTNGTPIELAPSGNAFEVLSDGTFLYFGDHTSLKRLRVN